MKKTKNLIFCVVVMLSACAVNYGNVVPLGNNKYEITSTSDTKKDATSKALSGARAQCKDMRYKVIEKNEKYTGPFENESQHAAAKAARDILASGFKASTHNYGVGSNISSSTKSTFDDAFETVLKFECY